MPENPAASLPAVHHRLSVQGRIGSLQLDATLELRAPWTVLFGPSASGKSTLLRAACGLLPGRSAQVSFERCTHAPPQQLASHPPQHRALAYAPQDTAIFPHLNVLQNVRFPSQVCAEKPGDSSLVSDAIELFRLNALSRRHPADLSGGERQRVALARAFATPHACLMMLDEPFSGLDRTLRDQLLPAMRDWLTARGIPCLSVTHDVDEALLLDAHVVRLDAGTVVARGPAADVLAPDRERLLRALQSPERRR